MTKSIYVSGDWLPAPPRREPPLPRYELLRRLVEQGVLSANQADAVQRALHLAEPEPLAPRLRVPWPEIAGYLGGGLVVTGAVVLVASFWDRLTAVARTGLGGGFTVLLLIAGVVAAGGPARLATVRREHQTARLRVAGALLALAAGATAITVGVALPDDAGSRGAALAAGTGLLVAAGGYALLPTVFGLVATVVLGISTVMSTVDATIGATPLYAGLALAGSGILVAGLAVGRVLRHRLIGLGIGAGIAVVGAQQPLGESGAEPWAYLLTFALGVGCLLLYRWVRTWMLLVFGVIAVTLAVPEAIWDVTNGAVGGAAALLVAGSVLLVASGLGLRAHRHAVNRE